MAAVLVALIFNLASQRQTRAGQRLIEQGQKQDRELAESSASRAEAAAALTEGYTQRVVDALEAIARSGLGGGGVPLPPPAKVRWLLAHHVGDTYRLENIGDAKAWAVKLSADDTVHMREPEGGPDLDAGEALTFMAGTSMGTRDRTITVTWASDDIGTGRGTWKYPLPGRPR